MITSPKHKQTKTHQTNQKYHKNADQTRVNKYNETVAVSGKGSSSHLSHVPDVKTNDGEMSESFDGSGRIYYSLADTPAGETCGS